MQQEQAPFGKLSEKYRSHCDKKIVLKEAVGIFQLNQLSSSSGSAGQRLRAGMVLCSVDIQQTDVQ